MNASSSELIRSDTAGPLSGRTAAMIAVESALTGRGFVMETLRKLRQAGRLDPREAGLATQISLGALRHLRTIRHVLASVGRYDSRRTPQRVQAILYGAAYQMIWMDRIPLFAAASEAVELARASISAGAARMANALLRRLSAAIGDRRTAWNAGDARLIRIGWAEACGFVRTVVPIEGADAALETLAALTGETPDRIRELRRRYGEAAAAEASWASQALPAMVVQRNRRRLDGPAFRSAAIEAGAVAEDCRDNTAFIAPDCFRSESPLLRDGGGFVQDSTASAAARLLGARPGERVLDLCAAPGGKSLTLALDLDDRGEVVACDVDAERLKRVAENAARLGLGCVRTTRVTADGELQRLHGVFDAALLDVPCSNTGVIARRPEARFGLTAAKVASLVKLQSDLLRRGAACVRPGGRLVYSTCSIEPEENEHAVQAFLATTPEWRLIESQTTLPRWGPRWSDWRDGGFAALVSRHA